MRRGRGRRGKGHQEPERAGQLPDQEGKREQGASGPQHSTPFSPRLPSGQVPPHEARPRLQAESPLLEHDLFGAYTPGPHR